MSTTVFSNSTAAQPEQAAATPQEGFETDLRRIKELSAGDPSPLSQYDAKEAWTTLTELSQFIDSIFQRENQVAIAQKMAEVREVAEVARQCVEHLRVIEGGGIRANPTNFAILRFLMAAQRLNDDAFTANVAALIAAFGEKFWESELVNYGKIMVEGGNPPPFIKKVLEAAIRVGREKDFNDSTISEAEQALTTFNALRP